MNSRDGAPVLRILFSTPVTLAVTFVVGNDTTAAMLTRTHLDELETLVRTYVGDRYDGDERIDWEQLWEDIDGATLPSGVKLKVTSADSPLHRHIRALIEEL